MNYEKMWWTLRHMVEGANIHSRNLELMTTIEVDEMEQRGGIKQVPSAPLDFAQMWISLCHACQKERRFHWLRRQMKLVEEEEEMERKKPAQSPAKDSMKEALDTYRAFLKSMKGADSEQGKALGEILDLMEKIDGPATGFSVFGGPAQAPSGAPGHASLDDRRRMDAFSLLDAGVKTDEEATRNLPTSDAKSRYLAYRGGGMSIQDAFQETVMDLAGVPKDEREGGVKG